MDAFLSFRRMITPIMIQIVFVLAVIASVGLGIGFIIVGLRNPPNHRLVGSGVAILILGPLVARLYCEALIVIFRINETLTDIDGHLRRLAAAPAAEPGTTD